MDPSFVLLDEGPLHQERRRSGREVLGPLPRLYRIIVSVIALAVFVAGGVWAAYTFPYPRLVSVGASIGLAVGADCAFLLLHDNHRTQSAHIHRGRRTHYR